MDNNAILAAFADELSAHRYLERVLWPNGPTCPLCGERGRIGKLDGTSTRIGAHKCYACRRIFSITSGTIFYRSHVPLHKWLQVIYLTEGRTTPLRPFHLARIVDVTCKTAISMLRRLEKADRASSSLIEVKRRAGGGASDPINVGR
jgi:transposase-like protein